MHLVFCARTSMHLCVCQVPCFPFCLFFFPFWGGAVAPMRLDTRGKKRKRQAPTAAPGLEPGIFCCSPITWFGRPTVRGYNVLVELSKNPKTRKTSRVNRRPLANARSTTKKKPQAGVEPTTFRLLSECSTTKLLRLG